MTFTQVNARLKNILRGWLLVLGLKECLVEYATLYVKSEVILRHMMGHVWTSLIQGMNVEWSDSIMPLLNDRTFALVLN